MEIINSMSSKSFLIFFWKVVLIKTFASSRDLFKKLLNFDVHVFFEKKHLFYNVWWNLIVLFIAELELFIRECFL